MKKIGRKILKSLSRHVLHLIFNSRHILSIHHPTYLNNKLLKPCICIVKNFLTNAAIKVIGVPLKINHLTKESTSKYHQYRNIEPLHNLYKSP